MAEIEHKTTDFLGDSLNSHYGKVQALTANTPDELARLISSIRFEVRVVGFTAHSGGHTAYITSNRKIKTKG